LYHRRRGSVHRKQRELRIVWGLRSQVDLGHVLKVLRDPIRGFHDLLRQNHNLF
jgi:hypothetical protein